MITAEQVEELPGATRLAGPARAWRWSPAPGVDFGCVISGDGEHLLQVPVHDWVDEQLVREVLGAAVQHSDQLVQSTVPLSVIRGQSFSGRDFDVLAAEPIDASRSFVAAGREFGPVTVPLMPGYDFEFKGDETLDEVNGAVLRRITPGDFARKPSPFVRIRFDNPHVGTGTLGGGRLMVDERLLRAELRNLEGAADAFVEFENWRGEIVTVHWRDTFTVLGGQGVASMDLDQLLAFAARTLRTG